MNFDLDTGQWVVIGLSAFLFLWYFIANMANRQKGIALYRWLRRALEPFGTISNAEWIGSSNMGARVMVGKPAKPFRRIEAYYLLEPREFLPYWLFSRLRGKRDEAVIKLTLRFAPKGNLEIKRLAGRLRKHLPENERIQKDFQVVGVHLEDPLMMTHIEKFLSQNGSTIEKILIQPQAPHLEIHTKLKPLLQIPADSFLAPLLNWYQDVD